MKRWRDVAQAGLAYPAVLLGLFVPIWIGLAWRPWYRQDWLLENALVLLALPLLALGASRLRLSNAAYTCLFVFLCAHEIGAHYTYSMVPYDRAFQALSGQSLDALLGFRRNHFDRLVHFLFGLLLLPAAAQVLRAHVRMRGAFAFVIPILVVEASSAIFELIEWSAALVFGGDLGQAYLGTQGDAWDAQWDMALALLGAVIAQSTIVVHGRLASTAQASVRP
jgi:putative membrane protein